MDALARAYKISARQFEITRLNILTGMPPRYRLDGELNSVESGYLGGADAARTAAEAAANQATGNHIES